MRFSVQTTSSDLEMLREAVSSNCDKVRFGSEFCEWKIPSLAELEKAFMLVKDGGKDFTYVTPRVSDSGIGKLVRQLDFLNGKGEIGVVMNDLGVLNILGRYPNLIPHLGRQLVHVPARCPWLKRSIRDTLLEKVGGIDEIYSQTSLNYPPTIKFFQDQGVRGVDLDWIPRCFPYYDLLAKAGIDLSVHLHLVPVTLTRKCHTARLLGEDAPDTCSRPCTDRAFLLKNPRLGLGFFLHENAVFRLIEPSKRDVAKLPRNGISEFVITMSPITRILNRERIEELVLQLRQLAS